MVTPCCEECKASDRKALVYAWKTGAGACWACAKQGLESALWRAQAQDSIFTPAVQVTMPRAGRRSPSRAKLDRLLGGAYYARLQTCPSDKAPTHASAGLRDFLR
jgi:hypothetical protein